MSAIRRSFALSLLPERLAIVRLSPDTHVPPWAWRGTFFSITRTSDELSIVCLENTLPAEIISQTGWRAFKVHGPFVLSEVGVLSAIAAPLAEAGVSIFVISTFDTDYVLLKSEQLTGALVALKRAGHQVQADALPS